MSTSTRPAPSYSELDLQVPPRLRMSEEEFLAWCDKETLAEWVDGEVIVMAPVSGTHDSIQGWLRGLLEIYVDRRDLGVIKGPEFMVRLALGRRRSRRMPDVLFVQKSRLDIIKPNHVEGAPDLIVEIVSPDSESRDWRDKYLEYQEAGVREYWVFDPPSKHIEAYAQGADGKYALIAEADGRLASTVVTGWYLKPAWVWKEKRPNVLDVLAELGVK